MTNPIYVRVNTLPDTLQRELRAAGHSRKDIPIYVRETESLGCLGGDGYRAFCVLVDLSTGSAQRLDGSWGGANMFSPHNPVDRDRGPRVIPPDGAVIKGRIGGGKPVWASITISPANAARLLPPATSISNRLRCILGVLASLNSRGRREYFEQHPQHAPVESELCTLIANGLIVRNKAGAIKVTADGRNAAKRDAEWSDTAWGES